jgi:hypothetical protein
MNFKMLNRLFFIFMLLFIFCSCNEEETTAPTDENLLLNTSFEKNGRFSAEGWKLAALSDSSSDVPPNGGSFSLVLQANAPPEDYASIKVPVKTQYTINQLSFWAKSTGISSGIYGKAILSQVRNGSQIKSSSILIDEVDGIVWQNYSIRDTFNIAPGDSFMVQLTGGTAQLLPGKTYFDLCQLQGIK